jgi:hypothetical protein
MPSTCQENSQVGVAVEGRIVRRKGRGIVAQGRRQVVALLELVDGIFAVALAVGVIADEDLFRVGGCVRRRTERPVTKALGWGSTYTTDLVVLGGHWRGLRNGSE